MDLTVVTGTYGESRWTQLAHTRAKPSVVAERVPWVHVHADSLHEARNEALEQVETEWVAHLDADDELEAGYVEALARGTADLRVPSVRYIEDGRHSSARVPKVVNHRHVCEAKCLEDGNWLIVGTAVRTEMVREVGGWRDFPWSEDWDLWLRCYLAGATVEALHDAVYRAYVDEQSRNRAPDRAFKLEIHERIHDANLPYPYAA